MLILNSSPLIHLTAALGDLELLPSLYGRVLVPVEVQREIEAGGHLDAAASHLCATAGIEIHSLRAEVPPLLTGELDLGEAAVIALALEFPQAVVALDDLKARRVARRSGIALTGSLGILLDAKQAGKLDSLAEAIGRIQARGAWLSDALVERALTLSGEKAE